MLEQILSYAKAGNFWTFINFSDSCFCRLRLYVSAWNLTFSTSCNSVHQLRMSSNSKNRWLLLSNQLGDLRLRNRLSDMLDVNLHYILFPPRRINLYTLTQLLKLKIVSGCEICVVSIRNSKTWIRPAIIVKIPIKKKQDCRLHRLP